MYELDKLFISFESALDEYNKNVSLLNYLKYKDEYSLSNDSLDLLYIISGIENFNIRNLKKELEIATEGFLSAIGNFFKAIWNFIKKYIFRIDDTSSKSSNLEKQEKQIKDEQIQLSEAAKNLTNKIKTIQNDSNLSQEEKDKKLADALKLEKTITINKDKFDEVTNFKSLVSQANAVISSGDQDLATFTLRQNINVIEPSDELINLCDKTIDVLKKNFSIINDIVDDKKTEDEMKQMFVSRGNNFKINDEYDTITNDLNVEITSIENKSKKNRDSIKDYFANKENIDKYYNFVENKVKPMANKLKALDPDMNNLQKKLDAYESKETKYRVPIKTTVRDFLYSFKSIGKVLKLYSDSANYLSKMYKLLLDKCKELLEKDFHKLLGMYPKQFIEAINTIEL